MLTAFLNCPGTCCLSWWMEGLDGDYQPIGWSVQGIPCDERMRDDVTILACILLPHPNIGPLTCSFLINLLFEDCILETRGALTIKKKKWDLFLDYRFFRAFLRVARINAVIAVKARIIVVESNGKDRARCPSSSTVK